MKRRFFLAISLFATGFAQANMAYWGPKPGNVAGRNTSGQLRVRHEVITADMRNLPGGKIQVYADYQLESRADAGAMTFLFVASGEHPVNPEIILDGEIVHVSMVESFLKYNAKNGSYRRFPADSIAEVIGMELEQASYSMQKIDNTLWSFTLFIPPGLHHLKIGYALEPTGYERNDLRYFAFPYYLGNKYTRPLYDTIIVRAFLPEGVAYEGNISMQNKGPFLESNNISKFKRSHLFLAIYKDVQAEIEGGRKWWNISNYLLWIAIAVLSYFGLVRLMKKRGRIGAWYAMCLPVGLAFGLFYYFSLYYFYQHFSHLYGAFLKGSFGKGYYFLAVPVIGAVATLMWLVFALAMRYSVLKKYARQ